MTNSNETINARLNALEEKLEENFENISNRFDIIEESVEGIKEQLDAISDTIENNEQLDEDTFRDYIQVLHERLDYIVKIFDEERQQRVIDKLKTIKQTLT